MAAHFACEPFAMNLGLIWKRTFKDVDKDVGLLWFEAVGPEGEVSYISLAESDYS